MTFHYHPKTTHRDIQASPIFVIVDSMVKGFTMQYRKWVAKFFILYFMAHCTSVSKEAVES